MLLLKASFIDPRYKSLNDIAKGVIHFTKQAIRDMCMKVAEYQATKSEGIPPVPTLPPAAAAAVKQESTESYKPPLKKPKIESSDYDDWLTDVIYLGTEQKCQKVTLN